MMQWIFTEYFNIYSQYLSYFSTIIILLTTATGLSVIKVIEEKNMILVKTIFLLSFFLSIIDTYFVFDIYNGIRTMFLLMSSNCKIFQGDMVCDMNLQEQSIYLKIAIMIAIFSFVLLVTGYFFKIRNK